MRVEDHRAPAGTAESRLEELLGRQLGGLDLLAVHISGIEIAKHSIVIATGIDKRGRRIPMGVYEGTTSDPTACSALVANLVKRGLHPHVHRLFVTDGGSAILFAVRAAFGRGSPVQHCRVRKRSEILSHLPAARHVRVSHALEAAWGETDPGRAKARLRATAADLRSTNPGAAQRVLEGVEEVLTVTRLRLPPQLRDTLSSTAGFERGMLYGALCSREVAAVSASERAAAALLKAEHGAWPVQGWRDLDRLAEALRHGGSPQRVEPPGVLGPRPKPAVALGMGKISPLVRTGVDLAALLTTIALTAAVAAGVQGVFRVVLALVFVTLVPGWAILGGSSVRPGIHPIVLAVPLSLALCATAATVSLWLRAWQPMILFGVLVVISTTVIGWRLATALRGLVRADSNSG